MCGFFSFVATKDKLHAHFGVDSHEDIIALSNLKHLDKRDPQLVRCEVTPKEPMTLDFENWTFKVDQDLRPDWFFEDEWRERAIEYLKNAPAITEPINYFASQAYFATANINRLLGNGCIRFLLGDARVRTMWGSSQVGKMRNSSQVGVMWNSSRVGVMRDSSRAGVMWNSSQVGVMWNSSRVGVMRDSSQVGERWDSSQVGEMLDSSRIIKDNRIKQEVTTA